MPSAIDRSADMLALTLVGDTGAVLGVFLWRQEAPEIVPLACGNGVLTREGVTALRNYCDTVLGLMDAAALGGDT